MKQELVQYVQKQLRTNEERIKMHTHDVRGNALPQRFLFVKLRKYIDDFLTKQSDNRLVIIPGLRGVGKTTLMAQVCSDIAKQKKDTRVLFLSLDEVRSLFDAGIADVMQAYEEILGTDLEALREDVVVFLDEVQSDPHWAKALKILRDKTSRVFFCCTGSSAVVLQTTPDLARGRAIFERMTPLCFGEFEMLKNRNFPTKQLKRSIRDAIYFSSDTQEAYEKLDRLKGLVNEYWSKVDRRDIERFLTFGSLPFTLQLPSEASMYDAISLLVDGIIKKDLPMLGSFDTKTLAQAKRLLFILAENDVTSLRTLERVLDLDRLTIIALLDAFEKAELLVKVSAYGSNMSVAKKPAKYLFMSPAVRMSFFAVSGQDGTFLTRKGKLLEDSVGSHLYREFVLRGGGAFRYDSAERGADFIVQMSNNRQVVVEVGLGDKNGAQVVNTLGKINAEYGIVFSNNPLSIEQEKRVLKVPLDYYFLM